MFPRKLYPGQKLTATEQNGLQRAVYRQGHVSGTGSNTVAVNPSGLIVRDNAPESIYGRISGAPTGSVYPWVEVAWDGAAWDDLTVWPGRSGTAASAGAKELTGSTTVPTNTIVQLTPLPGGGGWGFVAGLSGTSVDTRNSDNTDQITATTKIVSSLTDGTEFVASGTENTLKGLAASPTQKGMVTTANQSVGGTKTAVAGTASSRGGWWATAFQTEGPPDSASSAYAPYYVGYEGTDVAAGQFAVQLIPFVTTDLAAPVDIDQIAHHLYCHHGIDAAGLGTNLGSTSLMMMRASGAGVNQLIVAGDPRFLLDDHGWAVVRGGVVERGGDATVSGLTFMGGLYISGSVTAPAVGSITGLGTGVATFLATPSSANLAAAVTDETGTGALVFASAPTLTNPVVGTQTAGDNSTKAASTAYADGAVATAVAGTTVSLSYDPPTNVLTVTVNGVSDTIDLSDLA